MKGIGTLFLISSMMAASPLWASAPKSLYKVLGNGMVKDNKTGLIWQQQAQYGTAGYPLAAAASYCRSLVLGGYSSGWRLPTKLELESLIDFEVSSGAMIDKTAFPGTPAEGFWTSTSYAGSSGSAWIVRFAEGPRAANTGGAYWVRCVR